MELFALNEIPELNGVYSDNRYLYIPLIDERILLSSILSVNAFSKVNFGYYGNKSDNNSHYTMVTLPYLFNLYKVATPIKKEINIDRGDTLDWGTYRLNLADFIFAFGERFVYSFTSYKKAYQLPNRIEKINVQEAVSIDTEGHKLGKQGNSQVKMFLHIADEHTIPQYFFPAFQKRYGAPLNFTGVVYEDEYFAWTFVDVSEATVGQIFLAGVSWALNYRELQEMIGEFYKNDQKAMYQYPAWEGYKPDFHKKWPWSDEYDGSEPDLAVKHISPSRLL